MRRRAKTSAVLVVGAVVATALAGRLRPVMEPAPMATPAAPERAGPAMEAGAGAPEGVLGVMVPRRVADVSAAAQGEVVELAVGFGDQVAEGATIARLDDGRMRRELEAAEADLVVALARGREARLRQEQMISRQDRQKRLAESGLVSAEALEETDVDVQIARTAAEAAEAEVERRRAALGGVRRALSGARVVAPFSGTVAMRYHEAGENVSAGAPLVRLASLDVMVRFALPAASGSALRRGDPVEIRAPGRPPIVASVERVGTPVVASRLVIVEAAPSGAALPADLHVQVAVDVRMGAGRSVDGSRQGE